ncbi:putative F-box protein At3g16210 [Lolium rigidum]|uniref:putative F-box protein At3g16210 n=1 Tax=Lolium rigidum TaxID=89674 RepID=UPI001F5C26A5|nr:putative F-box protein At3g16210 [Lolium rigidum]
MLPSSAAAVLEDGDLVSEILLRLPPQPSSLPRASAVCKSLRTVASDPGFSRRFRIHHSRNRPLLGFFMGAGDELRFEPTLDPPNRVPQGRFQFPIDASDRSFMLLGCRHGFLLMLRTFQETEELLVWDPFNGHEHRLAIPPGFAEKTFHGAVLRAAPGVGDTDHFQVVLVSTDVQQGVVACVYSSETGEWGNLIATPLPSGGVIHPNKPAVLVGDSLYMLLIRLEAPARIIEFDVGRQSLAVIPLPASLDSEHSRFYSVMRADGGGLGMVSLSASGGSAQLWKRKTSFEGVDSWMLARTVELDKLISHSLKSQCCLHITGLAEENNVVFLWSGFGVFMVQLDSLQFKRLPLTTMHRWHPFESVYAAGI